MSVDYETYLASPEWQVVRRLALEQADNACRLCGATEELDVHHRTYERLGKERLADVVVLCSVCHLRHHDRERRRDLHPYERQLVAVDAKVTMLERRGAEVPDEMRRDRDELASLLANEVPA